MFPLRCSGAQTPAPLTSAASLTGGAAREQVRVCALACLLASESRLIGLLWLACLSLHGAGVTHSHLTRLCEVCQHACSSHAAMHMSRPEDLLGIGSPFPPCGLLGSNSGPQACWQATPSPSPLLALERKTLVLKCPRCFLCSFLHFPWTFPLDPCLPCVSSS